MLEKTKLIIKILHLAYLVHEETSYCVFINFSGHVDSLTVSIRESKERWQKHILKTELYTIYKGLRDESIEPELADLRSKVEVLEEILKTHVIPYDNLDYEEEYTRHYKF